MKDWFKKAERLTHLLFIAMAMSVLPWVIIHMIVFGKTKEIYQLPEDPILFSMLVGINFIVLFKILMHKDDA